MTRDELQKLVRERILEAKVLLAAKRWSGAYYLAGYAVECGLKSCVLVRLAGEVGVVFNDRRFSEKCWTHNLAQLVDLARLAAVFDADLKADPELRAFWEVVSAWTEASRYLRATKSEAKALYEAIADKKKEDVVMDQKILVNELIEDGEKFLKRLGEESVPIKAAGWVKEADAGRWYLYIATPLVAEDGAGIKAAYHRVNAVHREMDDELSLDYVTGFKLVAVGNPITRKVLEGPRSKSGRNRLHFGEGGIRIGSVDVEEAYLYPLAGAPA